MDLASKTIQNIGFIVSLLLVLEDLLCTRDSYISPFVSVKMITWTLLVSENLVLFSKNLHN